MLICLPIAQNYACTACCAKFRANVVGFASAIGSDAYCIDATPGHWGAYTANDWIVAREHRGELLTQPAPLIDSNAAPKIARDLNAPRLRLDA